MTAQAPAQFRVGDRVRRKGERHLGTVVRIEPPPYRYDVARIRVRWESRHQSHTSQTVQSWIRASALELAS